MTRGVSNALAAVIALVAVVGSTAPSWAQGEPIKIGFIYPDSGSSVSGHGVAARRRALAVRARPSHPICSM